MHERESDMTLSHPMDCTLLDSSVHGIFQARVLEWGASVFSVDLVGYSPKGHKESEMSY